MNPVFTEGQWIYYNFPQVRMEVLSIIYQCATYTKLKVKWSGADGTVLPESENIAIPTKMYHLWRKAS